MIYETHNGFLTVKSTRTGDHRTFRVSTQKDDADFAPGERVIGLLTGPDNASDYTSFGFVKGDRVFVWKKRRGGQFDSLARMIERLDNHVVKGDVELNIDAKCRKCNRPLTTPESVESGIGPICRGRE